MSDIMQSSIIRPCDNMNCIICEHLIDCQQIGLRITVPLKNLSKMKIDILSTFQMKWNTKVKSNFMHNDCWDNIKLDNKESKLVKNVIETMEKFETFETLKIKVDQVVDLMLKSKSNIVFTGAGISVSAGINTYRGADGIDTIDTFYSTSNSTDNVEDDEYIDFTTLKPTLSHYAIAELNKMGKMDYCITQNCDGLHSKAGLLTNFICELHGSIFVEYCESCYTQYERQYCVDEFSTNCDEKKSWYKKCKSCQWNHYTGRRCSKGKCHGKLRDTIVNFGDDLHDFICGGILMASRKSRHADLCLCIGSSLSVSPANTLPLCAKDIIIVNLQETHLDNCIIRIWSTSDNFFQLLLPAIKLVSQESSNGKRKRVYDLSSP